MATSEPIRNTNDIQRIKQYLLMRKRWRDYALITMGLNTALRISDLLSLKWGDVFNFHKSAFHQHIYLYSISSFGEKYKKVADEAAKTSNTDAAAATRKSRIRRFLD